MTEKRGAERMKWPLKAEVLDARTKRVITKDARIRNISRTGFSMLTDCPLIVRVPYEFKIFFNLSQPIVVTGRILHVKTESIFQQSGVAIDSLSLGNRIQYNRFLSSRIVSFQRKLWMTAFAIGAAAGLIAYHILGSSLDVAFVASGFTAAALIFWPPF